MTSLLGSGQQPRQPLREYSRGRVVELYGSCCRPGQVAMAEESLDGTDVLGHLFREGQLVQGAPDPLLVRFLFHEAPLCHRLPVPEDGVPTQGKNQEWPV